MSWCIEALSALGQTPALHHQLICMELQQLIEGPPGGRLMIFAPPGSAKTTYVSRLLAPWVLQRKPGWGIIGASHGALFAEENSSYALRYINEFSDFLGLTLESENVQRWRTTNRGDYLAAGVSAGIAGFRADLAVIDDPVKSRQDADSLTYRNRVWKWFNGDLRRRLKPDGRVILMHTRWHEDDLAGRLLRTQRDKWRILNLPALANSEDDPLGREIGEPLWTGDAYGYGEGLHAIRDELHENGAALEWSSLYQQDPRPADGALFKVHQIEVIDAAPASIAWVRGWDLAATKDMGTLNAPYTSGVKIGRTPDNRFVVGDVRRARLDPEQVENLIVNTAKLDGRQVRVGLPQDPGQAGKFQVKYLTSKLAGHPVESSPETGDKATRAAPFAAQVNVGNVALLRGDWNDAYVEELRGFPVGATSDQVDGSSRGFSMIFRGGAALWAALGRKP